MATDSHFAAPQGPARSRRVRLTPPHPRTRELGPKPAPRKSAWAELAARIRSSQGLRSAGPNVLSCKGGSALGLSLASRRGGSCAGRRRRCGRRPRSGALARSHATSKRNMLTRSGATVLRAVSRCARLRGDASSSINRPGTLFWQSQKVSRMFCLSADDILHCSTEQLMRSGPHLLT